MILYSCVRDRRSAMTVVSLFGFLAGTLSNMCQCFISGVHSLRNSELSWSTTNWIFRRPERSWTASSTRRSFCSRHDTGAVAVAWLEQLVAIQSRRRRRRCRRRGAFLYRSTQQKRAARTGQLEQNKALPLLRPKILNGGQYIVDVGVGLVVLALDQSRTSSSSTAASTTVEQLVAF